MDRINNLPDEIVCHILSFLSTKEAALTSVLSKRWRKLFAFTENLRFEEKEFVNGVPDFPRTFIRFLDRVLALSGNSPVKRFSLKYGQLGAELTNRWICNVLSRGVLTHLHLDVKARNLDLLPLEVFTCKTLVKLKIGREFLIKTVPKTASLPSLKSLFFDRVVFFDAHYSSLETLVSACPVLEELVMNDVQYWAGDNDPAVKLCSTVSCPTLRRLTMTFLSRQRPQPRRITFDTPSLSYLEYYDSFGADAYPTINLDSLVEAKLYLTLSFGPMSNPENLIKGLRNVQILNLSSFETIKIIYLFREAIPVFKNLFRLTITSESNYWSDYCCPTLTLLLKNSPNLNTLVFKSHLHCGGLGEEPEAVCECLSGYSCLLSCRVKVLEITSYGGTNYELGQLKHFLEKLPSLELVKVRSFVEKKKLKSRLITDLQNLLRPSKCKKFELSFVPLII